MNEAETRAELIDPKLKESGGALNNTALNIIDKTISIMIS